MPRLRLLPAVIAACAVAAPLYVGGTSGMFGPASAQPVPPPRTAAASPEAPAPRQEPGFTDLLSPATAPPAAIVPAPSAGTAGGGTCSPALADMLAAERKALDARAAELELMAAYLEAAEQRAAAQIASLETARVEVAALIDRRAVLADADLNRLVTIYGNMKPKDAARLLNGTETEIVVVMLDRMEERRAAPILAEMDPAKVNELTRALATRRQLAGDQPPPQSAGILPLTTAPRM